MTLILLLSLLAPAAETYSSPEAVLSRFDSEPTVRQVQEMALEYSKTDPRYVEAWLSAAKNAAWLPEFQAKFGYDYGDGYGYDYLTDPNDPTAAAIRQLSDADADTGYDMEFRAKWRFDKLVMSSERIRVISEAQDVVKLRDKILEEVTRVYFDRRRLQVDMLLNPGDLKTQLKNELRLQELTAQLDAFTGGRFSAALGSMTPTPQ
jgi:hypothetical protein